MLLVQFAHDVVPHLADLGAWSWNALGVGSWHLGWHVEMPVDLNWSWLDSTSLGQLQGQQFDTDVFKGARNAFSNFMKTGQLWAFLIGLFVGYVLRTVTTYG